jgi:hypothetical protein
LKVDGSTSIHKPAPGELEIGHIRRFPLGIGNVHLRRIESHVQIFYPDLNELAHASAGVEQHFDQEPVPAGMAIGGFDQPFDPQDMAAVTAR